MSIVKKILKWLFLIILAYSLKFNYTILEYAKILKTSEINSKVKNLISVDSQNKKLKI